jgi:hypothetical protein
LNIEAQKDISTTPQQKERVGYSPKGSPKQKDIMMVSTGVEPATLACHVSEDISTTL